jgi:hypothetical protein
MNTTGFDQATNSYKYNVNTGVAAYQWHAMAIANRARYSLINFFIKELGKSCPSSFK